AFWGGPTADGKVFINGQSLLGDRYFQWALELGSPLLELGVPSGATDALLRLLVDGSPVLEVLAGKLNLAAAQIGFFGHAFAVQPAAYTPSNVTPDRSYNANSTSLDELADVLGTLIADLQSIG